MKFLEALSFVKKYSHAIFLNRILPPYIRSILIVCSSLLFLILSIFLLLLLLEPRYGFLSPEYHALLLSLSLYEHTAILLASIAWLVYSITYSLHTYSRYFLLRSIERVFGSNTKRFLVSYEAANALGIANNEDLVEGLLATPESDFILSRLRVSSEEVKQYGAHTDIEMNQYIPLYNKTVTLGSLWKMVYEHNDELQKALLAKKIQKETYDDTCDWLDRILENDKRTSAWWWRENLSRTRGVLKSLSYGGTYFISKYARELAFYGRGEEVGKIILHKNAVIQLEEALSKNREANAVVVGSKGTGRHALVRILSTMIEEGDCYSEIEYKRMFEFDNTVLGSLDAQDVIAVLERSFEEAVNARNIIFVINDIHTLSDMVERQGVDLFQVLERYINHPHVSLVCVSDQAFYEHEQHKALFDRDFEVIHIEDMNTKLLIPYIQDQALIIESLTGRFFPSHSISILAAALTKYFIEESPLIKVRDLMYKIATSSSSFWKLDS